MVPSQFHAARVEVSSCPCSLKCSIATQWPLEMKSLLQMQPSTQAPCLAKG